MEQPSQYQPQQQPQQTAGGIHINLKFIKTPSGVAMVVNWFLLFICWCIMAGWRGSVGIYEMFLDDEFYLGTTVFPWLEYIAFFIILSLGLHHRLQFINWPITFAINCCVWAFLILISSSVIAANATKYDCRVWVCSTLQAATAFGFITIAGLLAQAFFHFREYRSPSNNPV